MNHHHHDDAAEAADQPPKANPAAIVAIVAMWLVLYIPLTWLTQRGTWSWLRSQQFALYRMLILAASIALWAAPAFALVATMRIARQRDADGRPRLVLAYLQTLTIILVVVVETTVAELLLAESATAGLSSERWLALALVVASVAICAGTAQLARIAFASPRLADREPVCDLRMARRCSLAAGISALFAAPLSYVNRTSTPTAGAVLLFGGAALGWLAASRPPSRRPHQ